MHRNRARPRTRLRPARLGAHEQPILVVVHVRLRKLPENVQVEFRERAVHAKPHLMNRSCIAVSSLAALAVFAVVLPSCSKKDDTSDPGAEPEVGLAPKSAWPKFRGDAAQTGRGRFAPTSTGGKLWQVKTAKGIFSS